MPARKWRSNRCWLCESWLALVAAGWLASAASAQPLPDWVDKVHRAPPPAELTDALIDALGDPRWVVRDSATRWLKVAGPDLLGPLRQRYHQTLSQEVRLRIREVAKEVFLRDRLDVTWGFVGVLKMGVAAVPPEIMEGAPLAGVRIRPQPHTPAVEAGLQSGDVIVMVNGEPLGNADQNAFEVSRALSRRIRQFAANHVITLSVVRDGKLLNHDVTLMPSPSLLARFTPFGHTNPAYYGAHEDFRSYWTEHFTVPDATQPPATGDEAHRPL